MNKRARNGKSSELIVAGELIRNGLDVYLPLVDDQAIDMIIRQPIDGAVKHYDVQVKSVSGYNLVVGLSDIEAKSESYILIVHYRHTGKPDEYLYLLRDQVLRFHKKDYKFGDLRIKAKDRDPLLSHSLLSLAEKIKTNSLPSIPEDSLPCEQTPVTPIRREEEEAANGGGRGSAGTAQSHELIIRDPEILEGKPFLAGSRMGVHAVIGYWQTYSGDVDRILREFPHLTREQIHAALAFYRDHESQREHIDETVRQNRVAYEKGLARQSSSRE